MSQKRLVRSTTVLCVRKDGKVVMAGDGQVTLGESIIKHTAKKIRRLPGQDPGRLCRVDGRRLFVVQPF
jgi:Proteasome subunit